MLDYINRVLENMPAEWLSLTTHRLDIYNEALAKTEFLAELEKLYKTNMADSTSLAQLPTAYDYIRLGHPLSSVLEWSIAKVLDIESNRVVSFSSRSIGLLAILRKNLLEGLGTVVYSDGPLPLELDPEILRSVYGYKFEIRDISSFDPGADSTSVFVSTVTNTNDLQSTQPISRGCDFYINVHEEVGSVLMILNEDKKQYISEIQHVRRRETIAMTPADCLRVLHSMIGSRAAAAAAVHNMTKDKAAVQNTIASITGTETPAVVASSGLSMQYAIVMGLIHNAKINHPEKKVKVLVPTNCYGGTNDQARRVAACIDHVELVDLLVDGDNDMVNSIDTVLDQVANEDAIPFIIAEIPTNPRVEVPNMQDLKAVLTKPRTTADGRSAIDPVFILDQTFCPNTSFLGEEDTLAWTRTIAYVSGSKFPSGGQCTAGYCVSNRKGSSLMDKIALHLAICDNEATPLQYATLAQQLPSMIERIKSAYDNTREFVTFIEQTLPAAKINFVSEELAQQGFTPSVFSLDLPTKGDTEETREAYKRALNLKLINQMITEIPNESKYCVSYGQLKGCYWTIPATSTQGTTKEGDKDYIVRAALSGSMDLTKHKEVFAKFVESIK